MQEIKNVLSIDMDYVMAPCIQLYNRMVGPIFDDLKEDFDDREVGYYGTRMKEFWDYMDDELCCSRFFMFDNTKYEDIKNLLSSKLKGMNDSKVYFGKEHDSILTFLCGDINKKDYVYNIYNVDHHHDIYYQDTARDRIENFACAGLAEWGWYLYDFGKLNKFYWIKNKESHYPFKDIEDESEFCNLYDYENVTDLEDIFFDYIFVCKSEYYVPPKYHFLFDSIKSLAETILNTKLLVDNTSYCDGRTRFPAGW